MNDERCRNESGKCMKNIVLFGSEIVGKEAIQYLGKDNVICFCDNNPSNVGKIIEDRRVISFEELLGSYRE